MKKFITVIPLQIENNLDSYRYQAVGNTKLQMNEESSFPILSTINGYVNEGEDIRVIAILGDSEDEKRNCKELQTRLDELCKRRGITCNRGIEQITESISLDIETYLKTFQDLINYVEDDDELFACITYGTKMMPLAVINAIQYAYRLKHNTSISCIVYGYIERKGENKEDWKGYIYDVTPLVQLNEITRLLSERKVENPQEIIKHILDL